MSPNETATVRPPPPPRSPESSRPAPSRSRFPSVTEEIVHLNPNDARWDDATQA